jgi:HD domain-containing protein
MLVRTLEAGLEQHRLITAERELLEQTLQGSVGILVEILSHVNPAAFSRSHRIRRYVRHMANQLKLPDAWQYELAGTLSQIGCVVVPPEIMEKLHLRRPFSATEQDLYGSQSQLGHNLLAKIPRLNKVARMIAQQESAWGRTQTSDPVLIGANLLRIALDFDEQILQGKCLGEALGHMRQRKDYNPKFVDALRQLPIGEAKNEIRLLKLEQLKPGMIMEADLFSKNGLLLLAKGQEVTESAIARLESFASLFGIAEPVSVIVGAASEAAAVPEATLLDFADTFSGFTGRLPV